jgi:hypothetical protein
MLREAQPLKHTDRARPIIGRHQQIRVNIGTNLAGIQPPGEHRPLQHDRVNTLTGERTHDLDRERKVTR